MVEADAPAAYQHALVIFQRVASHTAHAVGGRSAGRAVAGTVNAQGRCCIGVCLVGAGGIADASMQQHVLYTTQTVAGIVASGAVCAAHLAVCP